MEEKPEELRFLFVVALISRWFTQVPLLHGFSFFPPLPPSLPPAFLLSPSLSLSLSLCPSLRGLAREQRSEILIRETAPYLIYCKLAVPSLELSPW